MEFNNIIYKKIIICIIFLFDILLTIQGSVRIVEPEEQTLWLRTGDDLHLKCVSTHAQPLSWYHGETLLRNGHRRTVNNQPINARNQRVSDLYITRLRDEDSGAISCRNNHQQERDDVNIVVTNQHYMPTVKMLEPRSKLLHKNPGQDFTLKCEGQGESLEWLHNGTVLQSGSKLIITTAYLSNRIVTLMSRLSARAHDAGTYECRSATNALDRGLVQVLIQADNPSISHAGVEITEPRTEQHYMSNTTSLHIKCSSAQAAQVHWFKNNGRIVNGEHGYTIMERYDDSTATWISVLSRMREDSNAVYKCQNIHDTLDYDIVEILVNQSNTLDKPGNLNDPVASSTLQVAMRMRSTIHLRCSIEASVSHVPAWTKHNLTIRPSDKYAVNIGHRSSTLLIRHTDRSDTGIYRCSFTEVESEHISGAIVYNVTGILCPPLEPSTSYRTVGCDMEQYVGERCQIACTRGSARNTVNHGSLTCLYDDVRDVAYWSDTSDICSAQSSGHGATDNIPSSLSHVMLRANENRRLLCGHSRVTWVKSSNHVSLQNDYKYDINDGTLIIKNAGAADADLYICKLYSEDGTIFGHKIYNVTVMHCPELKPPENGELINCPRVAVFGDTCEYTCHDGAKHVSGSRRTTCELDDAETHTYWTGHAPICQGSSQSSGFQEDDASTAASNTVFHHSLPLCTLLYLIFNLYS